MYLTNILATSLDPWGEAGHDSYVAAAISSGKESAAMTAA